DCKILEKIVQAVPLWPVRGPTNNKYDRCILRPFPARCKPGQGWHYPSREWGRQPKPRRYTSLLRSREDFGLRTTTLSKAASIARRKASKPCPWKVLTRKLPPDFRCRLANSSASSARCTERAWSVAAIPEILGAMSEITRSTG